MVHDIGCRDFLMKQVGEDWDMWFFKMKSAMDYRIMQGEQWLRSEGSRIHFMLRYVPDIEPYRFVHRRYGDMWTPEGYFNRNKHTYGYRTCLPKSTSSLTLNTARMSGGFVRPGVKTLLLHLKGESSSNRAIDGNSENPGVIPEPPSAPVAKRPRYQPFEDELLADDFQNLRTVTYVSDDERNNRTFIIVLGGVQVVPGLHGEDDDDEPPPLEDIPVEERTLLRMKTLLRMRILDIFFEDGEPEADEIDLDGGMEDSGSEDEAHRLGP
ncbi:uncharacterized protein LOC130591902 [Beta vulgaris subsp. vulgaris]|uniref:uncharacterized protein LOC130591902 n=1 Tax=Beta vulgaris subsp. vulgaris TaxID=3555 RepID=UPI002549A922|nr:uncharacterized protein LOC130591902 [Beta vulgaris subsp. vulgaris]